MPLPWRLWLFWLGAVSVAVDRFHDTPRHKQVGRDGSTLPLSSAAASGDATSPGISAHPRPVRVLARLPPIFGLAIDAKTPLCRGAWWQAVWGQGVGRPRQRTTSRLRRLRTSSSPATPPLTTAARVSPARSTVSTDAMGRGYRRVDLPHIGHASAAIGAPSAEGARTRDPLDANCRRCGRVRSDTRSRSSARLGTSVLYAERRSGRSLVLPYAP